MFRADSESLEDLQQKVRRGVSNLRGLEIGDEIGVEVLSQLIVGRKSVSEIVELVYKKITEYC